MVEQQAAVNELRKELLDKRASHLNLLISVFAVWLGLFSVLIPLIGYFSFDTLQTIIESAEDTSKKAMETVLEMEKIADGAKGTADNTKNITETAKKTVESAQTALDVAEKLIGEFREKIQIANDDSYRIIKNLIVQNSNHSQTMADIFLSLGISKNKGDEASLRAAISDFNKAIELSPQYSRAYYERGLGYVALKDDVLAHEDFELVLKYAKESEDAQLTNQISKELVSVRSRLSKKASESRSFQIYLLNQDRERRRRGQSIP